jgi:hypothetical protein
MKPSWKAVVGGLVAVAVLAYAVLWAGARLRDANPDPRSIRVPLPTFYPLSHAESVLNSFAMAESREYARRPGADPERPFGLIPDLLDSKLISDLRLRPVGGGVYEMDGYRFLIVLSPEGQAAPKSWCAAAWPAPPGNARNENWPDFFVDPQGKAWTAHVLKIPEGGRPDLSEFFAGEPFTSGVRTERWYPFTGSYFR